MYNLIVRLQITLLNNIIIFDMNTQAFFYWLLPVVLIIKNITVT